ncbi:transporter [Flavobacterium album]|uniref:Transporter n=1 Tax=Flavobacterium album TaxID=2175091 RepID=A0A2S1R0S6_9FLAO|nr:EamA family transporter [Flavobacterium album]AWH86179.1 transporter [Flavobacterium album]
MIYLILSIICSVTVGAIFKISKKHDTCTTQIVTWNYVFALILCYIFFNPDLSMAAPKAHWSLYTPLVILLPSIFHLMATSIKHMGIVRTDAAQRLSLFIPIIAAWLIFRENFSTLKLAGLAVGFPAILLILAKKKEESPSRNWMFPVLVLFGFGIIDVLFKHVAILPSPSYTTSLFFIFCGSLAVTMLVVLYQVIILKISLKLMSLAFGALVGIFNFGNILFYLKAHKEFAENPSTVFAAMNMGVIVVGSIAGIFIFKEKLSKWNYMGIVLALLAIVLITLSQVYKGV